MKNWQFVVLGLLLILFVLPGSAQPQAQVVITGPSGPVLPNDFVVYEITASNVGTEPLTDTVVELYYDSHLTFISAPQPWDNIPSIPKLRILGDTAQPPGASLQFDSITFRVKQGTPCGITLDSRADYVGTNGQDEAHSLTTMVACPPSVTAVAPTHGVNTTVAYNTKISGSHFDPMAAAMLTPVNVNPVHKGSIANGAFFRMPEDVYISGTYAYVADGVRDSLEIVDVSNPAAPVHIGSITNGTGGALLDAATSVYVSGNYAYVASRFSDALEIVDVSNPATPVHKGSIRNGTGDAFLDSPESVYVSGNYAYVTSGAHALEIVDVSNPAAPVHKGRIFDSDGGALLNNPLGVYVSGNYAYVASSGSDALEIVDVSNLAAPVHMGSIVDGTGSALLKTPVRVYVSGNYAYVTSLGSSSLEIVDVSNPATPVHTGSIVDGIGGASLKDPYDVSVSGNYAYIASYSGKALEIVDVSNPVTPVHKGIIVNGTDGALISYSMGLYVSGTYAYLTSVVTSGVGALEIVDIGAIPGTGYMERFDWLLSMSFNLTNRIAGPYNVVVTNPDGQFGTLPGGFTVTSSSVPGAITIDAPGDYSYYFGERIKFFGNSSMSSATYLFLRGPGLPPGGAQIQSPDPKNNPVVNGSPSSFQLANSEYKIGYWAWNWRWETYEDIPLDEGIYEVYAVDSPVDYYNLSGHSYASISFVLEWPFIAASVNRSSGPIGTVFRIAGTKTGGDSPNYYIYLTMTNNTPPDYSGILPKDGVRPDDLVNQSFTGRNESFVQVWVNPDASWSYNWDTSNMARGSLLPGSQYRFYILNRPYNISAAEAIPHIPAPGIYNRASYTRLALGIEGPVHADYAVDKSSGSKPLTVTFTDLSTGIPTRVNLSFGDGEWANVTYSGGSVTHTYTSEGLFVPVIYASNSVSSDSGTNATISVGVTVDPEMAQAYQIAVEKEYGGTLPAGMAVSASPHRFASNTQVPQWGAASENRFVTTPADTLDTRLLVADPRPLRNWEKTVDYIFVNVSTKKTTRLSVTTPPKGRPVNWIAGTRPPASGTNTPGSGGGGGLPGGGVGGSGTCDPVKIDCTNCHALLISGGYDKDNNFVRYRDDIVYMYQTLKNTYCYPEDQISVLMSDGTDPNPDQMTDSGAYANSDPDLDNDGIPEVRAMADRANVTRYLEDLSNLQTGLTADDSLFVFTTNHGGKDPNSDKVRIWLWNEEFLWDYEFTDRLPSQTKAIAMTMEQCNSGGFVEDFIPLTYSGPQERVIATAASATEASNLNYFSFYWIEGVGGPAIHLRDTFVYARDNDPAAPTLEHPQYMGGVQEDAGLTLALSSCQKCPKPWALSNCNYCQEPKDPDGDGFYEDVDGVNGPNVDDVILYFNRMESIAAEEPVCAFDTNGNARIDFADVVNLFGEVRP